MIRVASPEVSNTTRRYPRSLADAFPDVRAECGYRQRRRAGPRAGTAVVVCLALVLVLAIGLSVWP
jgi:hypothetical protein